MQKLLSILLLFTVFHLSGQDEELMNYDYTYSENIKSVKFHIEGLFLTQPIVLLNSGTVITLSFDDLEGGAKDYVYSITHCDKNWEPSNLAEMEYLDGFSEERIQDYRFSFKTIREFTHYKLQLPNDDMKWKLSGNYLLKVYEDEDEKRLVITKRFMVVEQLVRIDPRLVVPSIVSKSRTHQEIDFVVNHEQLQIRNPRQEIAAAILQNGRWDNAVTDIPPLFIRGNQLVFDYQDKVVFPAGKEFRFLDIRSLEYRSENVSQIQEYQDGFDVILFKDQKRHSTNYRDFNDVNGNFVIETQDARDHDLSSNYANVLFSLNSPGPLYEQDVYLLGGFTDWQIKDPYKLAYNTSVNAYVCKVLLKQGFYNYGYAVVPQNDGSAPPDLSELEGDWFEAENQYTILIYYRPFGERYDRLIGSVSFSSAP